MRRFFGHESMSMIGMEGLIAQPAGHDCSFGVNIQSLFRVKRFQFIVVFASSFPFQQERIEVADQGIFVPLPHETIPRLGDFGIFGVHGHSKCSKNNPTLYFGGTQSLVVQTSSALLEIRKREKCYCHCLVVDDDFEDVDSRR